MAHLVAPFFLGCIAQLAGDACCANGWAVGQATDVPGKDIDAAYASGLLTTESVLITDAVPAEIPRLAGIIGLSPSTPSSHVALLAGNWRSPFAYPHNEGRRDALKALSGRTVLMRAYANGGVLNSSGTSALDVRELADIDGPTKAVLTALRKPPIVAVARRTHLGRLTQVTDTLKPADVKYFGGKASNFGSLRRAIPNESPRAVGISFDVWEAYLAQVTGVGTATIGSEITRCLVTLSDSSTPAALDKQLGDLQTYIVDSTRLPVTIATQLRAELKASGFAATTALKFRSSTNVEDGEVLSGAGLYDSYTGCIADDEDADAAGPSLCTATQPKERGLERAVLRTFASFYNRNAFLERLRHGIREEDVGMAMVVNPSVPDNLEQANGVITATLQFGFLNIKFVSQPGAESVTNPDGSKQPEEVSAWMADGIPDPTITFLRGASSLPLGTRVLGTEATYQALARLVWKASNQFAQDHAATDRDLEVDLEYKWITGGALDIKQIREVPKPDNRLVTPVLLNEKVAPTFCAGQGEGTGNHVLGLHRLKAELGMVLRPGQLSAAARKSSVVANLSESYFGDGALFAVSDVPSARAGFTHEDTTSVGGGLFDRWTVPGGTRGLMPRIPEVVGVYDGPVMVASDLPAMVQMKYASSVSTPGSDESPHTKIDHAWFGACSKLGEAATDVQSLTLEKGKVRITPIFLHTAPNCLRQDLIACQVREHHTRGADCTDHRAQECVGPDLPAWSPRLLRGLCF